MYGRVRNKAATHTRTTRTARTASGMFIYNVMLAAAIFAGGLAGISWTFYWQSCLRTWLILASFCIQPGERRVAAVNR